MSERVVRSRAVDTILGKWFGSKFRFVCGAVLLLASGRWIQANQKEVESNWQQAKTTAKSTLESLKNTTLDSSGLENATQALSTVIEQAETAIVKSESKAWNSVWGGLVTEENILFVAMAGVLLLGSLFFSGWKITLLAIPIATLLCAVPWVI